MLVNFEYHCNQTGLGEKCGHVLTDGGKIKDHYAPTWVGWGRKAFPRTRSIEPGVGRRLQGGEILARLGQEENGATKLKRAGEIRLQCVRFLQKMVLSTAPPDGGENLFIYRKVTLSF